MNTETFLVRTMSDTVESDIHRVFTIANEILPRYEMRPLSFTELRKIADGPFDLFLIPLIFAKEYHKDHTLPFNEAKRVEIRTQALEIARKHGFDVNPPDFIPGIEHSLKETKAAGLRNMLMTTGGRRFKHEAMEKAGIGDYFDEIVDRDETYYAKEQGLYYLYRKHKLPRLRIVLLSGTATYIRAGNNAHGCKVGGSDLEVVTVTLSTEHSYNDEETLKAAQPRILIRSFAELLPALKEQGLAG
ncbi:MAG: HAD hydrolase-like protein [Deltaproteobacteria bacterium]|nr:HAD hydrolase-like protein [Deltaproteobacteria bacterium]MDZ4342374.1 HAD hydrolase-like protein [Candidatus Binatia bacterium]